MMRKKWNSLLLFCGLSFCCAAQTAGYKFYTPLDSVKTAGFYNIAITPELSAHLKTDYSDLRIVNDSGKWVPHRLRTPVNEIGTESLSFDMKIIKNTNYSGTTELIIQNNLSVITHLKLILKNTTVERFCTLTGSDDLQKWFIINDSIALSPTATENKVESSLEVNFPSSFYKYFRIVINNKGKEPFNILSVSSNANLSTVKIGTKDFGPITNPPTSITQKDSSKVSIIKIVQQQAYHFDKMSMRLDGAKYFYRKVDLYLADSTMNSFAKPAELYKSFYISNNSALEFSLPVTNNKEFYLVINNEDNLPLKIAEVKTYNSLHLLTAYLEKGNYKLILDNTVAIPANYDLQNFTTSLNDSTPYLSFGKIIALEEKQITPQASAKNNKWVLWTSIIAALFILLLFTKKMMKEVDKRKQDDSL